MGSPWVQQGGKRSFGRAHHGCDKSRGGYQHTCRHETTRHNDCGRWRVAAGSPPRPAAAAWAAACGSSIYALLLPACGLLMLSWHTPCQHQQAVELSLCGLMTWLFGFVAAVATNGSCCAVRLCRVAAGMFHPLLQLPQINPGCWPQPASGQPQGALPPGTFAASMGHAVAVLVVQHSWVLPAALWGRPAPWQWYSECLWLVVEAQHTLTLQAPQL